MKHRTTLSALALAFGLLMSLNAAASAQNSVMLSGQVTDEHGEPLPGQTLNLYGPTARVVTTDANGRYTFSISAGTYSFYITGLDSYDRRVHAPPHYGLESRSFDVLQNMTLNLQLPFKKLSVHVQDAQGTAIANVGIEASDVWGLPDNLALGSLPTGTLSTCDSFQYSIASEISTDTNGDVDLWLLPTPNDPAGCDMEMCSYTLSAQPPMGSQLGWTSLPDVTLTQDSSVTITLEPGVSLTAQVTDAQGNPLSGLLVSLTTGPDAIYATTGPDGLYAFSVPAGSYSLSLVTISPRYCDTLDYPQYGSQCYNLSSSPFALTQNMTLDLVLPFQRVNVHVVDANDEPIAGAFVATAVMAPHTHEPFADRMTFGGVSFGGTSYYSYNSIREVGGPTTDANGNAALWLLPVSDPAVGGYAITAYPTAKTDLSPMSLLNVFVTGETSVTIRPAPPVTLRGRIANADGIGLPSQHVDLYGPTEHHAGTRSNGDYEILANPAPYGMRIWGGVPVDSMLHVAQKFHLRTPGSLALAQNRAIDLTLPFTRVNVHVVDANDQPVAGAGLTASADEDELTFGGVTFRASSSYEYDADYGHGGLTTDANGDATLWLLPLTDPGNRGYDIWAYSPPGIDLDMAISYHLHLTGETNATVRFNGTLPRKQQ